MKVDIAVIPARGGSKRILRKNIKRFCGKPMIAYAIEAALASQLFEHVIVSTDDKEIAETSRQYGAEVPFIRPAELADDFTPTIPVIAHAIRECERIGWRIQRACCIYPTNPFLKAGDIRRGLHMLEQNDCAYVFPVVSLPSPQGFLRLDRDKKVCPFLPDYAVMRTQDVPAVFSDAGQFYWGRADAWLAGLPVFSDARGLGVPRERVVDIDTPDDWRWAEKLYALSANA